MTNWDNSALHENKAKQTKAAKPAQKLQNTRGHPYMENQTAKEQNKQRKWENSGGNRGAETASNAVL